MQQHTLKVLKTTVACGVWNLFQHYQLVEIHRIRKTQKWGVSFSADSSKLRFAPAPISINQFTFSSTGTGVADSSSSSSSSSSLWLAPNPSKRWGELFFLLYSPVWLTLCLGIVVPFKLYEVIIILILEYIVLSMCVLLL